MDVTGRLPGSPPCHPGVAVRVAADRVFGPLVLFGLSGVAAELFEDQAARLTPLTDTDVDTLVRSVRAAPLLLGYRGRPAADLDALRDLLLRLARLADDLPEVADLDLTPVLASPRGAFPARPASAWPRPNPPTRSCAACADPTARWLRVALGGRLLPQLADGRREAAALGRVPGQDGGGAVVHRAGGRQRPRRRRA